MMAVAMVMSLVPAQPFKAAGYNVTAYLAAWESWNANTVDVSKLTHINYALRSDAPATDDLGQVCVRAAAADNQMKVANRIIY